MEQRGEKRREGGKDGGGENMNGQNRENGERGERWHREKEKQMEGEREARGKQLLSCIMLTKTKPLTRCSEPWTYFVPKVNLGFQASPVELFNAASWRAPLSKGPFAST